MLGERIALLRRRSKLSQRELAAALRVSPSAVGMYEQGRRIPAAELLVAMAALFGVSTDYLLTGVDRALLAAALRARTINAAGQPPAPEDAALLVDGLLQLTAREKSAIMEENGGDSMTAEQRPARPAQEPADAARTHYSDEHFMRVALALAREAAAEGEVPVGCVVVDGDQIVGRGRNRRETAKNALSHAELEAIDEACRTLGGWRLWRCTLYVTLEPCPMCAGAIINARIPRVVYGAPDPKAGSCGSLTNLFSLPYNHRPTLTPAICEPESRDLLQQFFRTLRENPPIRTWKKRGE